MSTVGIFLRSVNEKKVDLTYRDVYFYLRKSKLEKNNQQEFESAEEGRGGGKQYSCTVSVMKIEPWAFRGKSLAGPV